MFRSRNEEFIVLDDGEEMFRSWSLGATIRYLSMVNCDHLHERVIREIDEAYSQFRSPLDKLEVTIDIREL
jgi:hypothetical protein